MKVKIDYTVDVSDDEREAIRAFYGQPGKATREEVKDRFRDYGDSNGRTVLGDQFRIMDGEGQ